MVHAEAGGVEYGLGGWPAHDLWSHATNHGVCALANGGLRRAVFHFKLKGRLLTEVSVPAAAVN